jgi:hypothetical protein
MFIRAVAVIALVLVCWVGGGCHHAVATPNSGATLIGGADTVRDAVMTGTVVDSANSRPLPGTVVIVMVQGKDPFKEREHVAGGLTDSAGRYALQVPHGRYDMWYSRIGFSRLRRLGVLARRAKPDSVVVGLPESHVQLDPVVAPGGETKPQTP